MEQLKKIAFIGGDARSYAMASRLAELGYTIHTYALGTCGDMVEAAPSLDAALEECAAVILPMPAFDTQMRLPHPRSSVLVPDAAELFDRIGSSVPVFGGRVSPAVFALASDRAVNISDYAVSDEVLIRNAVPTAEGAIAIAMRELDVTLHGARMAVLGFGRIGFALATRLYALGADVTVAARKPRDVARIEGVGCHAVHLDGETALRQLLMGDYDIIFNTIPYRLISDEMLDSVSPDTVMVELASAPGGWNPSAACACRTVYAPGLPGICAPRSAGIILADALAMTLKEVTDK